MNVVIHDQHGNLHNVEISEHRHRPLVNSIYKDEDSIFTFVWQGHLKIWSDEYKKYLYHYDPLLLPVNLRKGTYAESRYLIDQYRRLYAKECGCLKNYTTTDSDDKNEEMDIVKEYLQIKVYRNNCRIDDGSLIRNDYHTQNNADWFYFKFFKYQNCTFFILNEKYGELSVYQYIPNCNSIQLYFKYTTNSFTDQVFLVNDGKGFVMHHWIWHPLHKYSYYDIDEFMKKGNKDWISTEKDPYQSLSLYGFNQYGDGMDFFDIIDGKDYFYYYFNAKYWKYAHKRRWFYNKFGSFINNKVIKINYSDFLSMSSAGVQFPNVNVNATCECGVNRFIEKCDPSCQEKPLVDCEFCHTKKFSDVACECQEKNYESCECPDWPIIIKFISAFTLLTVAAMNSSKTRN